jgi:hypothetical protein
MMPSNAQLNRPASERQRKSRSALKLLLDFVMGVMLLSQDYMPHKWCGDYRRQLHHPLTKGQYDLREA